MKNTNQFIEGGWSFNQQGEEVISVMTLVYVEGPKKKQVAERGDIVTSFDGEQFTLEGAQAPHKAGSSGRIYVRPMSGAGEWPASFSFFPSVCGLAWKRLNKKKAQRVLAV